MPKGYDSNGNRTTGTGSRSFQPRQNSRYDMEAFAWEEYSECLKAVLAAGGALRLGMTRDLGALSVGVYGDGDPYTEYLRPGDTGASFFAEMRVAFEGMADEAARKRR